MWIVRLALRRPYTFAVLALLLLIIGPLSIINTPVDIFPNIDIPVVSIVWQYQGLSAEQMADRIVTITERALTTTVDNIDHIESNSLYGVAVVKLYFQPQVNLPMAIAQVTAVSQTQLRQLPAGTTPPLIIDYSASSVSDSAARRLRPGAERAAAQRLQPQLHPYAARYHSGRGRFPIPMAASSGRCRSISTCINCRPRDCRQAM